MSDDTIIHIRGVRNALTHHLLTPQKDSNCETVQAEENTHIYKQKTDSFLFTVSQARRAEATEASLVSEYSSSHLLGPPALHT